MKAKELIEYLNGFDANADVRVLVANPPSRIVYKTFEPFVITDAGFPFLCIEAHGEMPFDDELTKVAEECEEEAKA